MLLSPLNVSVIEFALTPHCNRCFGYIAAAFDIDYWLVPQITTYYHQAYSLDQEGVDAAIRLLEHVIRKKGLESLLTASKRDKADI